MRYWRFLPLSRCADRPARTANTTLEPTRHPVNPTTNSTAAAGLVFHPLRIMGAPTVSQNRYGCGLRAFTMAPLLRECGPPSDADGSCLLARNVSYAMYTRNAAPARETTPNRLPYAATFERTSVDTRRIGRSVSSGAAATRIPSRTP